MIGKMILPKLGGTPQVRNTCMVFFQMALLIGYAYTHTISTRLSIRKQLYVHCAALLLPLLVLLLWPGGPFNVVEWLPNPEMAAIPQTLWLLLRMVGLPFLI